MAGMNEYWEALQRLKGNEPIRLPKGSLINKDTVALESGNKRGSIKKSRHSFSELITAIEQAANEIPNHRLDLKNKLANERSQKKNYRELYHQALNRELMLLEKVSQLERQLKNYNTPTPIGNLQN